MAKRIPFGIAKRKGRVGKIFGWYTAQAERSNFAKVKAFRNELFHDIPAAQWYRKDELNTVVIYNPYIESAIRTLTGEDKLYVLFPTDTRRSMDEVKAEFLADKAKGFDKFNLYISLGGLLSWLPKEERAVFEAWAEAIIEENQSISD